MSGEDVRALAQTRLVGDDQRDRSLEATLAREVLRLSADLREAILIADARGDTLRAIEHPRWHRPGYARVLASNALADTEESLRALAATEKPGEAQR